MIKNLYPGESEEIESKIGRLEVETRFWVIFNNFGTTSVACNDILHHNLRNPIGIMFLNI